MFNCCVIILSVVLSKNKATSFLFWKPKFFSILPLESHAVQFHLCRRASACLSTTDICYISGQILQAKGAHELLSRRRVLWNRQAIKNTTLYLLSC